MALYKGLDTSWANRLAAAVATIVLVLMTFTVWAATSYCKADIPLAFTAMLLLDIGLAIQFIQIVTSDVNSSKYDLVSIPVKLIATIVVFIVVFWLYPRIGKYLSAEWAMILLMVIQFAISLYMIVINWGQEDKNLQLFIKIGRITITPLEIVKILYIFILVAMLTRETTDSDRMPGRFPAIGVLLPSIYTFLTAVCFGLCSELGSFLILFITYLAMLWIFGRNRMCVNLQVFLPILAFAAVWFLCARVEFEDIESASIHSLVKRVLEKLVKRFGAALYPEKFADEEGYQGVKALEAIVTGEKLGISSERYHVSLPQAPDDFLFASLVNACGLVMGVVVVLLFLLLLWRGVEIALSCSSSYYSALAMAITVLITSEAIIHIAYNIGVFPITGIPLYFCSYGFTAVVTGTACVAVLLRISTGSMKL